jgi:hypothetical protein
MLLYATLKARQSMNEKRICPSIFTDGCPTSGSNASKPPEARWPVVFPTAPDQPLA